MRRSSRPLVADGKWQITDIFFDRAMPHSEFDIMSPRGDFFTERLMQDDLREGMTTPGLHLDPMLMIFRVTEVFAVGLAIAKATGWNGGDNAGFAFRWTGLAGRSLVAWAKPFEWETGAYGTAHDALADAYVAVPVDTPVTSLAPHVSRAVGPLFAKFDGYEPASNLIETCVRMLAERKM